MVENKEKWSIINELLIHLFSIRYQLNTIKIIDILSQPFPPKIIHKNFKYSELNLYLKTLQQSNPI